MKFVSIIISLLLIVCCAKCRCRVLYHLQGVVQIIGGEDSSSITIQLNETNLRVNDLVFLRQYDLVGNSTVSIVINNTLPSPDKFFYYIQVHSYLQEVILEMPQKTPYFERGTNLGQIFTKSSATEKNPMIELSNPNESTTASMMVVLMVYDVHRTPIPGYCSHLPDYARPNLNTTTEIDTISTFLTPGKSPGTTECAADNSTLTYEFRYVYFGKNEYSPDIYFGTIKRFLLAGKALDFGERFNGKIDPQQPNRRLFSRYAGMGLFFVVILRDSRNDTLIPISYVPSASYGCPRPVLFDDIHCDLIENTAAKVIYVLVMLVGIGIMIFGRGILFIRASLYSFMIAGFLVYTVHSLVPYGGGAKLAISLLLGIILALTWIRTLLQCHAIYRLTDFMAAIILGYTFSCLILFGSADAPFFVSSVNYYLVLCSGILLITLWYFSLLAVCGVIIMNIMVGCTFIVLTLLFIFDGNLQYAYVNNWRRIRNDDFRYALCFPHLEVVDWISIVLWFVIFGFGLSFQQKCECAGDNNRYGEPRIFRDPEQQPLIAGIINSGDSNDVFLSPTSNSQFLNSLTEKNQK